MHHDTNCIDSRRNEDCQANVSYYCLYDIGALQLMSVLEVGKDNNGRTVINWLGSSFRGKAEFYVCLPKMSAMTLRLNFLFSNTIYALEIRGTIWHKVQSSISGLILPYTVIVNRLTSLLRAAGIWSSVPGCPGLQVSYSISIFWDLGQPLILNVYLMGH